MNSGERDRQGIAGDQGSAVIEFIVLVVAVLMPMVFIVIAAAQVHAASIASEHAVREAARAFMMAPTPTVAQHAAHTAAAIALRDHGLELPATALRIQCSGPCLQPETTVTMDLQWRMVLPWLPEMLQGPTALPIQAAQTLPIDVYRGEP
jgi:Flp pilus assembly protein TadG